MVGVAAFSGVLLFGFLGVVPFGGGDGCALWSLLLAACHDHFLAWVNIVEGRALALVFGALFVAGVRVNQPDCGFAGYCCVDGCETCGSCHSQDVAGVLMIVEGFACQDVGDVVEVDADVARLRMLSDVGGLTRSGTKEAP